MAERGGGEFRGAFLVFIYIYIHIVGFFFLEDWWSSGCKMGFLVGWGGRGGTERAEGTEGG